MLPLSTGIETVAWFASVNDAVHVPVSLPGVIVKSGAAAVPEADDGETCATYGLDVGTGDGAGLAVQLIADVNEPV